MKKLILMLGHKMQRGKDTAALHLHEFGFKRYAFADAIRTHCQALYSLSDEQVNTPLKCEIDPRYNIAPRTIMQDFGAEQRARDEDIWARIVATQIKESTHNRFAITDFRFPNELFYMNRHLSDCEIVTVKITRENAGLQSLVGSQNNSETALDSFSGWDFIINNDQTIMHLHFNLDKMLDAILR